MNEERLIKLQIPMGPRLRILQEAQMCFRQENFDIYIVWSELIHLNCIKCVWNCECGTDHTKNCMWSYNSQSFKWKRCQLSKAWSLNLRSLQIRIVENLRSSVHIYGQFFILTHQMRTWSKNSGLINYAISEVKKTDSHGAADTYNTGSSRNVYCNMKNKWTCMMQAYTLCDAESWQNLLIFCGTINPNRDFKQIHADGLLIYCEVYIPWGLGFTNCWRPCFVL